MNLKELQEQRKKIDTRIDTYFPNMDEIIEESYRVVEVAHNAKQTLDNLDFEFERQTGLDGVDITFLFFATALQCIRQYVFTSFTDRLNDKDSAKPYKQVEKNLNERLNITSDGATKRYYVPTNEILISGVPYDAIKGSKNFDLGFSGNNHRFKTLGHDPLLGWVFGTANIMTGTLTNNIFKSYHVKNSVIYQNASTVKVMQSSFDRGINEPIALATALVKQGIHILSDKDSIVGLPLPMSSVLTTPDISMELTNYCIEMDTISTIGKQISGAIFINTIIAMIHRLFYDETKYNSEKIYEVKTRKILSYSNLIASVSNVIQCAIRVYGGDTNALKSLDIGGIIVTIYRLINDYEFIRKIKDEFVFGSFNKLIQGKEYNF